MSKSVREVTDNVISAVEDGVLSWETVAKAALKYMSEDDVADMVQDNDWGRFIEEDEEEDEEDNICLECGNELGEDGRCYNPDCDQYDPLSQYFDDDEDEDEGHFWALVFMEKGDDVEQVEKYEDFDAVRSDFAYMTQQKPEDFDYVVFQEVTIEDGKENIKIIGEFREGELIESKKTIKEQKLTIDESQSQEIGNTYRKLSAYYGVDLEDLVYGPEGFMQTKYPNGFGIPADIIYLEDKWDEFEQWMKEKHSIDFEAIREKNHDSSDDDEDDLDESLNSNEARALEAVMTAMKRLDRSADFSEIGERQGEYQFEVRYWGEWIVSNDDISDPDNEDENFEDWDWQELTEEWAKKLNMIVLDVNKKFNVKISWTTGEKNWIDVFVSKSTLEEAGGQWYESLEEAAGGLALDMTVEDIAEKHNVDVEDIEEQIMLGIEVEKEHTSDEEQAKRIAMDHLVELPDYYTRLIAMEKAAELEDNVDEELVEAVSAHKIIDEIEIDFNEYDIDISSETAIAYVTMTAGPDAEVWLKVEYDNILEYAEFSWEADAPATYVPYGEQSVLFDDGKGGLESVELSGLQPFTWSYELIDETKLEPNEVCKVLGVTEEQLVALEDKAIELAEKNLAAHIEEQILDDASYWPEQED